MTVKQFIKLPKRSYTLHGCYLRMDSYIAQKKYAHPGMQVLYFQVTKITKNAVNSKLVADELTEGR